MIGLAELAIVMAVVGFVMILASIAKTEYSAQLKSIGILVLVIGLIIYFALLLFG